MIGSVNRAKSLGGLLLVLMGLLSWLVQPASLPVGEAGSPRATPIGRLASQPVSKFPIAETQKAGQKPANEVYGKLPISFEVNLGQTDPQVKFLSRCNAYSLFLTSNAAVLTLRNPNHEIGKPRSAALRVELLNCNPAPYVEGLDLLPGKSNYLIGNAPQNWLTNVPTYRKVKYHDVYPGVDVIYYGNHQQLEYDIEVTAGTDPNAITWFVQGAQKLYLDKNGDLVARTALGLVRQHRPFVYQELDGIRQVVGGRYMLRGKQEIGFRIDEYDTSKPLIIDPVVTYSTFLGGTGVEQSSSVAVDPSGNAYVTGFTKSIDFPTASASQPSYGGGPADAFVAKLDPTGTALIYCTYLGGSGNDWGTSIAVDSATNVCLTGFTSSPDFPTTAGAFQTMYGGDLDIFVTKLDSTGSDLLFSTYLGGNGAEENSGIAIDRSDNLCIAGDTSSTNFPTANPMQGANAGGFDAFIAKFNLAGVPLFSTYLGGGSDDRAFSITDDSSGNIYVTGATKSSDFPTTASAIQRAFGGGDCSGSICGDAFVSKLDGEGSRLIYSTYLGGRKIDGGLCIAVDSSGNAYVTGTSSSKDFPITPSAYQRTFLGGGTLGGDAFVAKLNPEGTSLIYSSYIGGHSEELATSIAVDSLGNAHITGITTSSDFPIKRALQNTYGGGFFDAFLVEINSTGSDLIYSTYLGGRDADFGSGITLDSSGNAYVAGDTLSADFPLVNPFQPTLAGSLSDVFIMRIASTLDPPPSLTSLIITRKGKQVEYLVAGTKSKKYRVVLTGSGFTTDTQLLINGVEVSILSVSSNEITAKLPPGRVGDAGLWPVQARNSDGASSNSLTIEIRNE